MSLCWARSPWTASRSEGVEGEEESASICTEINKAASGINTTLII
eukprot:COSAG02_NODE_52555_length_307_cov_0.721154_1_plen_44_part_10